MESSNQSEQSERDEYLSRSLSIALHLLVLMVGAAVLIVQIVGAKMLTPYLGNSHFVWANQIIVTLLALAGGYYVGGWLAERSASPMPLFFGTLIASLFLGGVIGVVERACYFFMRFGMVGASLLASMLLFFIPLFFLAMVGPFSVRWFARDMSNVGRRAGRTLSLSTLGSVFGAFASGFWLILQFANSVTLLVTASALALNAVVGIVLTERSAKWRGTAVALGVMTICAGWIGVQADLKPRTGYGMQIDRAQTGRSLLLVTEDQKDGGRYLLDDFGIQSSYDPATGESRSMYAYALLELARVYVEDADDVLCVGLGGGFVPMKMARAGARVEAVEINPHMVEMAEKYFDYDTSLAPVQIGDGRYFVRETRKRYDVIVLDAFLGDSAPSHLMTREAFGEMRACLKSDGVLLINAIGDLEKGKNFSLASMEKTLRHVFPSVQFHHRGKGNFFFVAGDRAPLDFIRQPDFSSTPEALREQVKATFANSERTNPADGIVLRDDFNPVAYYDAAYRAELRARLAWLNYRKSSE